MRIEVCWASLQHCQTTFQHPEQGCKLLNALVRDHPNQRCQLTCQLWLSAQLPPTRKGRGWAELGLCSTVIIITAPTCTWTGPCYFAYFFFFPPWLVALCFLQKLENLQLVLASELAAANSGCWTVCSCTLFLSQPLAENVNSLSDWVFLLLGLFPWQTVLLHLGVGEEHSNGDNKAGDKWEECIKKTNQTKLTK